MDRKNTLRGIDCKLAGTQVLRSFVYDGIDIRPDSHDACVNEYMKES